MKETMTFPEESVTLTTSPAFPFACAATEACVEVEPKFCAIPEDPIARNVPPFIVPVPSKSSAEFPSFEGPTNVTFPPS